MNPVEAKPAPAVELEIKEVKSESELINIDLNIPVIKGMQDKQLQSQLNQLLKQEAVKRQGGYYRRS